MTRLTHDREHAIGRQELGKQIVLDLAGKPGFALAIAIDDEQFPVFSSHHLIDDAGAVG